MDDATLLGYHVLITTTDGNQCYWHKQGQTHLLRPELGQLWIDNFNRSIFDALPDGRIIPKSSDPLGQAIEQVELVAVMG